MAWSKLQVKHEKLPCIQIATQTFSFRYYVTPLYMFKAIYYKDTDEIPGFFLLLKTHIFIARSEDAIFIFHEWGYWGRHGY